jgi:xanthine dehydrogenase YagT iron-sulfur-binding subunit
LGPLIIVLPPHFPPLRIAAGTSPLPTEGHSVMNDSAKPPGGLSRRGFLTGSGLAAAAATGLAPLPEALSQVGDAGDSTAVGPGPVPIALTVNGQKLTTKVEPRVTLLDALRNQLDVTGCKRVCDRGTCGACTVIMGGKTVYACSILAIDAQGKAIETIEGLGTGANMHPVSRAFVDNDAQQCGYCTPGFVMACTGFLKENPNPTEAQVNHGLGGNLCRCGTYMGIRKAVLQAAAAMKGGKTNG